MSNARKAILSRMRHALGRRENDAAARAMIEARLLNPAPTLLPRRSQDDPEAWIELFVQQAKSVQASVELVASFADLPAIVADYLRRHNLPLNLVTARHPELDGTAWDEGLWDIRQGIPSKDDPTGLTVAVAGIAETGTLMLASDQDYPTTLAYLPETSIIVLPSANIHGAYEQALEAFRGKMAMPRSINLITGPSRSGDIEQTIQLGAHGPRRLLVVLVDEAGGQGGQPSPDVQA